MSAVSIDELVRIALHAAEAGQQVLIARSGHDVGITTKGADGDLVTEVDLASERAVRAEIARHRPDDPVHGEELGDSRGRGPVRWVIDPLDGTTNFTRGLPFYGVSVAAQDIASGDWLAGAVAAPALGRLYSGGRGLGAFRTDRDETRRLPILTPKSSARLIGTGLSYDSESRADQARSIADLLTGFTDLRRFGAAAIDLCLVAEGSLDAFHESDLAVHDWAAGALIAAESGALVERPASRGEPMIATRVD